MLFRDPKTPDRPAPYRFVDREFGRIVVVHRHLSFIPAVAGYATYHTDRHAARRMLDNARGVGYWHRG